MNCVHCETPLADFEDAVRHHSEEHPRKVFDPIFYTDAGEWSNAEDPPDEL